MDGVLVHEETAIPGAGEFLARLTALGMRYMV
ncbi:MAG: TIGR01457 family HAD-type hydrolase, partial [Chloroflexi bacterium]|nr:TIGR01457 family HAD-type hydrolase [Chloroflexota bacterium]